MVRYTGPKNRIARRFGANIFGRLRNPMLHKPNPPGVHGARRRKKSNYGVQLDEQQKLKAVYGMLTQKQLLKYYREAVRLQGPTADNLIALLESRLDILVYRLKFAATPFAAHQLVSHGHVLVDGKKVDIRSYQVRPGQKITLREKARKLKSVQDAAANAAREIPEYLVVEGEFEGKLASRPAQDQVPLSLPINIAVVCDFLAHSS